jgi:hypothetical protein
MIKTINRHHKKIISVTIDYFYTSDQPIIGSVKVLPARCREL